MVACLDCGKEFTRCDGLSDHQQWQCPARAVNQQWSCPKCDRMFTNPNSRAVHLNERHKVQESMTEFASLIQGALNESITENFRPFTKHEATTTALEGTREEPIILDPSSPIKDETTATLELTKVPRLGLGIEPAYVLPRQALQAIDPNVKDERRCYGWRTPRISCASETAIRSMATASRRQ